MKISNVCPASTGGRTIAFCDVYLEPGVFLKHLAVKRMEDGTCRAFSAHNGNDRYSRIVLTAEQAVKIATAAVQIMGGLKANATNSEAA